MPQMALLTVFLLHHFSYYRDFETTYTLDYPPTYNIKKEVVSLSSDNMFDTCSSVRSLWPLSGIQHVLQYSCVEEIVHL